MVYATSAPLRSGERKLENDLKHKNNKNTISFEGGTFNWNWSLFYQLLNQLTSLSTSRLAFVKTIRLVNFGVEVSKIIV